jgi:elongation factor Ts
MNNTETKKEMPYSIFSYVHHNGKIASLVTIKCQTDFALRTDLINNLGRKMAMHVVATGRFNLEDPWILDGSRRVQDVINEAKEELGESILVEDVVISGK